MDTTATARSDFATRLYDKLAGTQAGKNLFLSPFSIRVALAMCAAGARGETRRVLADLIGAPASVKEQNRQFARLLESVQGDGDRPVPPGHGERPVGAAGLPLRPRLQEGRRRLLRRG